MWLSRYIGRQLMALMAIFFVFFSIAIAWLVGDQSGKDLKTFLVERTHSAAQLFKAEFEGQVYAAHRALDDIEYNSAVAEQLTLLVQNGPLYVEDTANVGVAISDAETSYYLLSQIKLVNPLRAFIAQHAIDQIAVYHLAPFGQFDGKVKLPSLVVDKQYAWFFRHLKRSDYPDYKVYKVKISALSSYEKIFNVSAIYQKKADFFYQQMGIQPADDLPAEFLSYLPEDKRDSGTSIDALNDGVAISIWTSVFLPLSDPSTWQLSHRRSVLILGVMQPTSASVLSISDKVGADLALSSQQSIVAASLSLTGVKRKADSLIVQGQEHLVAEVDLDIPSLSEQQFKVMALNSTEPLTRHAMSLARELTVLSIATFLLMALAIYHLISRVLNKPLKQLLAVVKGVEAGDFSQLAEEGRDNELGVLSSAINRMVASLKQSSETMADSNEALELQFKQRTIDLIEAQQQLIVSEKMASLGQMVAGVSHEISTPLGNAVTAISFCKEHHQTMQQSFHCGEVTSRDFSRFLEQVGESIHIANLNIEKATELVSTLKRISVGQSKESVTDIVLKNHIDDVLLTLQPSLKNSHVVVNVDIDAGIIIKTFTGALYHVVSNMIVNATKHAFADDGGQLNISATADHDMLALTFADNGVGIDEDTQKRIFDPFFTTAEATGGTGLGLYMVYNIVRHKLGGVIELTSQVGQGSEFVVRVPLSPPPAKEHEGDSFSI